MANKKSSNLLTILDQAKLCPNEYMSSEVYKDDKFPFGHDFTMMKSQERTSDYLGAFFPYELRVKMHSYGASLIKPKILVNT